MVDTSNNRADMSGHRVMIVRRWLKENISNTMTMIRWVTFTLYGSPDSNKISYLTHTHTHPNVMKGNDRQTTSTPLVQLLFVIERSERKHRTWIMLEDIPPSAGADISSNSLRFAPYVAVITQEPNRVDGYDMTVRKLHTFARNKSHSIGIIHYLSSTNVLNFIACVIKIS